MNHIFKYLKYVFYRGYLWQEHPQKTESSRVGYALMYVSTLLVFYVLALLAAIEAIFKISTFGNTKASGVIFAISCVVFLYWLPEFVFLRGDRYKKIIAEFSNSHETKTEFRIRGILLLFHYVAVFILMIFFAVLPQFTN